MARRGSHSTQQDVQDFRHDEARRANNPPAGIAPTYEILDAMCCPLGAKHVSPLQPDLFGETPLSADKQIEFYQHEVGWAKLQGGGDRQVQRSVCNFALKG